MLLRFVIFVIFFFFFKFNILGKLVYFSELLNVAQKVHMPFLCDVILFYFSELFSLLLQYKQMQAVNANEYIII